jgi:hypothetical protein
MSDKATGAATEMKLRPQIRLIADSSVEGHAICTELPRQFAGLIDELDLKVFGRAAFAAMRTQEA